MLMTLASMILVTSDSAVLLGQNHGQWNRNSDNYYHLGLRAGRRDARRNLNSNYHRYRREFSNGGEADFKEGYDDGYQSQLNRGYRNRGYGYRQDNYPNSPYG